MKKPNERMQYLDTRNEQIPEQLNDLATRNEPIPEEEMTWLNKYPDLREALENLQGNILRGHGRRYSVHLLLQFKADTKDDVKAVKEKIRSLTQGIPTPDGTVVTVTSALQQRAQSANQKTEPGALFCNFFLSATGYRYLDPRLIEGFSEEFRGGMRGAQPRLNDPADDEWEKGYEHEFHAMVLLACDNLQKLRQAAQAMRAHFQNVTAFLKEEWGKAKPRSRRDNRFIEHFGYVDGISQPLFFQKDVDEELQGGMGQWDPSAGPRLVLIRDPGVGPQTKNAYGSYLVFRKLAQDAPGFDTRVTKLARRLGQKKDYVRALIIGRYPDGRPLVPHNAINNFAFQAVDPRGEVCPYHAHIRKVNPRGDAAKAREHRIARRGITYEAWGTEPQDDASARETPPEGMERNRVGLLFMCYQSDLKKQFEFIQSRLANNENFLREETGVDPIIGQGDLGIPRIPHKWPVPQVGGQQKVHKEFFESFVTLGGGEYFFAPSISFLRKL